MRLRKGGYGGGKKRRRRAAAVKVGVLAATATSETGNGRKSGSKSAPTRASPICA